MSPADSHSAWTVPSSPNGPWSAIHTTGAGSRAASSSRAPAAPSGPPGPPEVDQPGLDGVAAPGQRGRDGAARHERDVVFRGRAAQEHDDRLRRIEADLDDAHAAGSHPLQSPPKTTSKRSSMPLSRRTKARTSSAR